MGLIRKEQTMITVNGIPVLDVNALILVVVFAIIVYGGIIYVLKKKNYRVLFAFWIASIVFGLGLIVFELATNQFRWNSPWLMLFSAVCTYLDVRQNGTKEKS